MSFSEKMYDLSYENNIKIICADKLPKTDQIIELSYFDGEGLEELFYIMKEENIAYAFYVAKTFEEVYQPLYFYAAIRCLEKKHNIVLTEESILYEFLELDIILHNSQLETYKNDEFGYQSLTFIKNNIQYTVFDEEVWYQLAMDSKQTIEEFVEEFLNRYDPFLCEEVEL
ncbi:hypothetical protein [Bacillus cereus group sp. BceL293]|uniref:hypothetical protein n=1 Tax=Bacillus cereus group sp. BceL293 TaxID=3444992 RepID=UPI003F256B54